MAWDEIMIDFDNAHPILASKWNAMIAFIKGHMSAHIEGGADEIAIEDLASSNLTKGDASITKHGLMPKLDGNANHVFHSDGTQKIPLGGIGWGGSTGAVDRAILVADGENTDTIDGSGVIIVETLGDDDTTVPTSKAVADAIGTPGDVVGPASATDGAMALFDETTGKLLKEGVNPNTPKRTIFLSCVGGWLPTTAPAGAVTKTETSTNKVNFNGALFAAGASDVFKEFGLPMPKNYSGGAITAIPYIFVPSSTDASNHTIILSLAGVAYASGGAGDAAYGTKQESTITVASSIAGKVVAGPATSAITIAGTPAGNNWTQFRVGRTGSDTYTGDITVLGWLISYTTNNFSDE